MFLSENVMTKNFHQIYFELKFTQMKIKLITVFHIYYAWIITEQLEV